MLQIEIHSLESFLLQQVRQISLVVYRYMYMYIMGMSICAQIRESYLIGLRNNPIGCRAVL